MPPMRYGVSWSGGFPVSPEIALALLIAVVAALLIWPSRRIIGRRHGVTAWTLIGLGGVVVFVLLLLLAALLGQGPIATVIFRRTTSGE